VGEDFPESHLDWMRSQGIDTSGVERVAGKSFYWVGEYDQNLNEAKTLSTHLNVLEHFRPKVSPKHAQAPYLFLANIDPELQEQVTHQVESTKLIGCDSMNFWITGKNAELKKVLQKVDLLSINEGEAYLLSNQRNLARAAEVILGMGPRVVIIKRGEYGATLFTPGHVFLIPAYPVTDVVDPTGAGDSFAGALMGTLASHGVDRNWSTERPAEWERVLREGVIAGCVMASFTVEDFSLSRLMRLDRAEWEGRRRAFQKMIHAG
jgi:sugar/nucleoside kinase (ribokinase family)